MDFVFPLTQPVMRKKEVVDSVSKLKRLARKMIALEEFAFDTETNTLRVNGPNEQFLCVGISISWGAYHNYYIPLHHRRDEDIHRNIPEQILSKVLKVPFEKEDVRIIGHNLRPV